MLVLTKLKRSNDRKVTNLVTKNGKQSAIANTFGLPAGKEFSCPSQTSICAKVCYAGKLEKVYPAVRAVLMHNWEALKDAGKYDMCAMLDTMIEEFKQECDKKDAPKVFRIHWDGDFFSDTYAEAWKLVITQHTDVQFWVYTRVESAARILTGIDNLALYFSTDADNKSTATNLRAEGLVRLAYLADTFEDAKQDMLSMTGKVGAKCPENNKSIPLISANGSACFSCGLCINGKADIRFSATKK
jgi:ferredoxin